ncbi:MAG: HAD-IA family hydrolase [Leptospiraceae bacterium]|nr:HAD-IA family hydrolase [Leptospiraceae bacterium]MCP5500410.1 HAD-IA family hydrolase [Leptospiraceae bacterium]
MSTRAPSDHKDRYIHHKNGHDGYWIELINTFLNYIGSKRYPMAELYHSIFIRFEDENLWEVEGTFFELYEFIKSKGIGFGLISNWDLRLRGLLSRMRLLPYFDPVLISAEFGYEKPSLKIFQKAMELSGESPENHIYVGDKPELDYYPPRKLGWNSFIIKTKRLPEDNSIQMISTLSELIHRIDW